MLQQVGFQGVELADLRRDKPQFHQGAFGVIDHKQDAWRSAFLETTVIRTIDLDQFIEAFRAQKWLVNCPALFG